MGMKRRIVAGVVTGVLGIAAFAVEPVDAALAEVAAEESAAGDAVTASVVPAPPNADYRAFIAAPDNYYRNWQAFMAVAGGAEMSVPELPKSGWSYNIDTGFLFNVAGIGRLLWGDPGMKTMTAQEYLAVNGKSGAAVAWPADLASQPVIAVKRSGKVSFVGVDFPAYGRPALLANRSGDANIIVFIGVEKIGIRHGLGVGLTSETSAVMNGIQLGVLRNRGFSVNGFQIGVLNSVAVPGAGVGLQIGLLNDNGRIMLPLLNVVY
ncbi:MAG: hypothetical protein PHI85_00530 [Victivallaceae bacterium]|nr:hypothetical protein [Victivallaceae bacterium]